MPRDCPVGAALIPDLSKSTPIICPVICHQQNQRCYPGGCCCCCCKEPERQPEHDYRNRAIVLPASVETAAWVALAGWYHFC